MSVAELDELYRGLHVPMSVMDKHSTTARWNLTQFLDMFSLPAATMFADISQVSYMWVGVDIECVLKVLVQIMSGNGMCFYKHVDIYVMFKM